MSALPIGKQVRLSGHFDTEIVLESARPLGKGFECRVRLPDGSLDEAVITAEEAAALAGASEPVESKTTTVNAEQLRLLVESARIRFAYAHDKHFAVSLSGIRTLPHQIEAVYIKMLRQPGCDFCSRMILALAKTIMAGLLIKEMKLREAIERIGLVVVMPHPEQNVPAHTHLKSDSKMERKAVETAIAHGKARGCNIEDVQDQNLGFDLRRLHPLSGELRLIELKGIGAATGSIFLSPNEKRIAEDRRDLYWVYIVTQCDTTPKLEEPIKDPARFPWHEVEKVEHYKFEVNALTEPVQLKEDALPYSAVSATTHPI